MKIAAATLAAIIQGIDKRAVNAFTFGGLAPACTVIMETNQSGLHVNVAMSTINGTNFMGRLYEAWEIPHVRAPHEF